MSNRHISEMALYTYAQLFELATSEKSYVDNQWYNFQ